MQIKKFTGVVSKVTTFYILYTNKNIKEVRVYGSY